MSQTVIITGASRGIGRECAKQFKAAGYNVAAIYRQNDTAAESLRAEIGCEIFRCDCSVYSDVERTFKEIERIFGGADILINNAGIAEQALFSDITEAMWDNMFNVNVKSVYSCTHAALPHMIHNKYGRIINISSMWGQVGASCEVHYSAAKAAIIGFTKALAKEVGLSGITVNCIAPGSIHTPENAARYADPAVEKAMCEKIPLGYRGYVEQITDAAFFLTGEQSAYITGQTLYVDGGLSLCQG